MVISPLKYKVVLSFFLHALNLSIPYLSLKGKKKGHGALRSSVNIVFKLIKILSIAAGVDIGLLDCNSHYPLRH